MKSQPQPTCLPLRVNADARRLLEAVAQLKGLRLSTWTRAAAIEKSREEFERLTRPAEAPPAGGLMGRADRAVDCERRRQPSLKIVDDYSVSSLMAHEADLEAGPLEVVDHRA